MRLLAAIIALAAIPAAAEPLTGKVVSVTDGDTVRVLDAANVQHKVRLNGIDAFERGQPFWDRRPRPCASNGRAVPQKGIEAWDHVGNPSLVSQDTCPAQVSWEQYGEYLSLR